jgi:TolB protein
MRQLYAHQEQAPIYLYWNPNGREVSFITSHPEGLALRTAPADATSGSQVLAADGPTLFWQWQPDGEQVLIHSGFTARQGDETRLAFVPVNPDDAHVEVPQAGFFQAPAISVDGRYYAFGDADPMGLRWLNVWEMENGQQVRLIFHQGVLAMGWSPARNLLAYTSPSIPVPSFYGPLQILDMDSGETEVLVDDTVLAFFWSPDGQSIAYLTLADVEDTEQAILPGVSRIRTGAASRSGIEISPFDRGRLARLARQADEPIFVHLWIAGTDGGEPHRLGTFAPTTTFINEFMPFFDQYALSHRLWSPDSKALVIPIQHNDLEEIVVVPVDGGEVRSVARGSVAFWSYQ